MNRTWKQGLLALPGIGLSALPKLACPVCWPAYAGLLSSVGLGFLISTAYLLPLTIAFLTLGLAALAFRAKNRRGLGPFLAGLVAAIGILLGKFAWESNATVYGGVGMLVAASLWNAWPRHQQVQRPVILSDRNFKSL
jgi:mercuric ion transport protein